MRVSNYVCSSSFTIGRTGQKSYIYVYPVYRTFGYARYATDFNRTYTSGTIGYLTADVMTTDKSLASITLSGSSTCNWKLIYSGANPTFGTRNGYASSTPTLYYENTIIGTFTATLAPKTCFGVTASGYSFNGGNDVNCYTCSTTTVSQVKTEYIGLGRPLTVGETNSVTFNYNTPQLLSGSVVCPASLSPSQLDADAPSPWGNDGALDRATQLNQRVVGYIATVGIILAVQTRRQPFGTNGFTSTSTSEGAPIIPDGYYKSGSSVFICEVGYYCIMGERLPCSIGYYCPSTGMAIPTVCTSGNYCAEGSSSQTACPSGYYCPSPIEKYDCPMGTYFSSTSATNVSACQQCQAGYYCPRATGVPIACSSGKYCPAGSGIERDCPEGFYCSTPSTSARCSAGAICPAGTSTQPAVAALTLPAGFFLSIVDGLPTQCLNNTTPNGPKTVCAACTAPTGSDVWESSIGCNTITCPPNLTPNAQRTKCIRHS
jgi:hypothetical protein